MASLPNLHCASAGKLVRTARPFAPARPAARTAAVACKTSASPTAAEAGRRQALQLATAAAAAVLFPGSAHAAKVNKEYTPVKDAQDGYSFVYLFGWQEVAVKGQDVVYKDVIEPLESVSVSITKTDKENVSEFGPAPEVAYTLADRVLTPPSQEVKVLEVKETVRDGRDYIEFEFAAKAGNYIRHALAVVTVGNGNFYTLVTGANERRWDKIRPRLEEIAKSFTVVDRFAAT
ncbi:hypothetical protein WJX81_001589 [Elliptochloris bilobata]|uniref:PsbP C-terminal domain-containing protein n=1 Tax=Elliptochloris bilobata TaxID=381761 RepID=A0AAW1QZW3_9CHLO